MSDDICPMPALPFRHAHMPIAPAPKNVLVDTGYWLALFDAREEHHHAAEDKVDYIEKLRILLPWPTLYETLRTRFVKNQLGMDRLERLLLRTNFEFIDDTRYRDVARDATFREARLKKRAISMCDMLIRLIIADTNVRTDALLTFNVKDFVDVCRSNRVELL